MNDICGFHLWHLINTLGMLSCTVCILQIFKWNITALEFTLFFLSLRTPKFSANVCFHRTLCDFIFKDKKIAIFNFSIVIHSFHSHNINVRRQKSCSSVSIKYIILYSAMFYWYTHKAVCDTALKNIYI